MKSSLQNLVESRQKNNLNATRLFLATLVIMSHCFPLSLGKQGDPLFIFSHRQTTFGNLAVDLFFFISGFLITASWLNSKSLNDYLLRRILRIVPAYVVAYIFSFLMATAFALHPFADLPSRLEKFWDVISLGYSSSIGNWIFPNNPAPFYSNGSLWTINPEFFCYLLIAIMGLCGFFKHRVLVLAVFLCLFSCYGLTILKGMDITYLNRRFLRFFWLAPASGCGGTEFLSTTPSPF